ncbi:hypothetical protein V6N13_132431 [Hibiscus sabdariffa]|uniref:Peptidase A1 domain-containing protein n=1 Tax=Hibiscus sabdariffa TaxID=183260 RepID=A0ABR2PVW3_9ROSI
MESNMSLIFLVWLVWLNGCFLLVVDGLNAESSKPNRVELPLRSASDLGSFGYFVSMRIGIPPKKYLMSLSTCTVLTWIKCRNECQNCSDTRFNQPSESRTYRSIPCSSNYCTSDLIQSNANEVCPKPDAPCRGKQKVRLENITIGCTEEITSKFNKSLDGEIGLGVEYQSFAGKALRQTNTTSFAYCLVDSWSPINVSGYLVFGRVDQVPNMQETDLLVGHWTWSKYYHLNVSGISVDGIMLDIPSDVWLYDPNGRTGGMILDTGSPLSWLAAPAYDKLVQAFLPSITKFPKPKDNQSIALQHCFDFTTGYNETLMPKLAIHFGNGAKFEPLVKSYVVGDDVKCLGFVRLDGVPTSSIGNILQQNHLWEFDLFNEKLRFAPSTCTSD